MVRISKLIALMLVSVLLLGGCSRSGSGSEPTDEYADKIEAAGVNVYPYYDLPVSLEELIEKNSPDIAATIKVVSRGESYKMATSYEIELGEVYLGDVGSGDKLTLVTSQYWNQVHGNTPDEVRRDEEGLQTMRTLADNMAWMLYSIKAAGLPLPEREARLRTNFFR